MGGVEHEENCGARGENERKNLCDWQNENLMNARNRVE